MSIAKVSDRLQWKNVDPAGEPARIREAIDADFRQLVANEAVGRWARSSGVPHATVKQDLVSMPSLSYRRANRLLTELGLGVTAPNFAELREFSLRLGRLPDHVMDLAKDNGVSPADLYREALG